MPAGSPARKVKPSAIEKKAGGQSEKSALNPNAEHPERRMRHRVMVGGRYVFGPGKADVLAAIGENGSLAGAARSLGMSYMRAWLLVREMQKTFAEPLIILQRGGKSQGGASLTPAGEKALALYCKMEAEALAATESSWKVFCELLRAG